MQVSQELRLDYGLRLTPELRQGLEVLELDLAALAIELRTACESNPALEEDFEGCSLESADAEVSDACDDPPQDDLDSDGWMEWLQGFPGGTTSRQGGSPEEQWPSREPVARPDSLVAHLQEQVAVAKVDPRVACAASLIAGCLDEDGFLEATEEEIEELVRAEGVPRVDVRCVEQALALVRSLDPAGVGWPTRQQSLVAQLQLRGGAGVDLPIRLLSETWEDFVGGRWRHVAEKLGVSRKALMESLSALRGLNPRPGASFAFGEPGGLLADVIVREIGGHVLIESSERGLPRLRLSATYRELWRGLGSGEEDAEARRYLRGSFESAKALLRNVYRRGDTLRRIAELVLLYQPEFLDRGFAALRPLSMTDLAATLELSVSTVSRAVANKYVATPWGTFPLRAFFSSSLPSAKGLASTAAVARERVRSLIAAEPAGAPLTDAEIRTCLGREGIEVALSTVRKYREGLGIHASHLRRQLRIAGEGSSPPPIAEPISPLASPSVGLPPLRPRPLSLASPRSSHASC